MEAILARTAQVAAEKRVKELEAAAAAREAEHLAHLEAERRAAKRAAAKASGPDSDRQREREKRKRSSLGGGSTSSGLPSSTSKAGTSEEQKEKRLLKMVGEVVVKSMSKYKDQLDHDRFKKYAKEVSALRAGFVLRFERVPLAHQTCLGAWYLFLSYALPVRRTVCQSHCCKREKVSELYHSYDVTLSERRKAGQDEEVHQRSSSSSSSPPRGIARGTVDR